MARNSKARVPADRIAVKRLAADGGFTYREISQRTGLPLSFKIMDNYDARALDQAKADVRFRW